ncbi:MAG: lipoyl(octanoyl) transferase LipB [Pseudomonadota bacterium]
MSALARWLGCVDYESTWRAMQRFTDQRAGDTPDELWALEHPPVFTLGMNSRPEHLLAPGDIPVIAIDRGGQVTYHGPGQLVVYPLVDLRRSGLGVRDLVTALEGALIAFLDDLGVKALARRDAPGVYVDGCKLASVGLRIRRGCSYHGLALNVAMDLEPYGRINPCGYAGLQVVDLARLGVTLTPAEAARSLVPHLWRTLRLTGEVSWLS